MLSYKVKDLCNKIFKTERKNKKRYHKFKRALMIID